MVLTPSTMLPLGTKAPDFSLPSVVSGDAVSLKDFQGKKALLIMFICKHCPYIQHIKTELTRLGKSYLTSGLGIVAISSNDAEKYPEDAPESLAAFAKELELEYPLLFDEDQHVAKAYKAACTPDFYIFDEDQLLVYRGQLDDSRPGNDLPLTGKDLRKAIDAALADQPVLDEQKPSIGCNIKWKSGNEPNYFKH